MLQSICFFLPRCLRLQIRLSLCSWRLCQRVPPVDANTHSKVLSIYVLIYACLIAHIYTRSHANTLTHSVSHDHACTHFHMFFISRTHLPCPHPLQNIEAEIGESSSGGWNLKRLDWACYSVCIHVVRSESKGKHAGTRSEDKWRISQNFRHVWCCFYYFVSNTLVSLLEALCARNFSSDSWISVFSWHFIVCARSLTKPFFHPSQPGSCAWLLPFLLCV